MPHPVLDDLRRTVDQALAADDASAALTAVRPHARTLAAEDGAAFRALVARLPEEAWHEDAVIASALGASFRAADAPHGSSAIGYFHAAEATLADRDRAADPDRVTVWLGHAAALRSLGKLDAAQGFVERTRALDAPGGILSVPVRVALGARSSLEAGMIDLQFGRLDDARESLRFALGLAEGNLTRAEHVECLGGLAVVEYFNAELADASSLAAEARRLAADTSLGASPFAAPALAAEMLIALERHDISRADDLEGDLLAASAHSEWLPLAHVVAGYLRLVKGLFAEALDELHRAGRGFRGWGEARFGSDAAELLRASVLVALDHGEEAWSILQGFTPYAHHPLCPFRVTAQLRLRHGDLRGAAEALVGCEALGDEHSPRTLMDVRMLRGAIEFERGELALSDTMVDRSLATMARTGSRAPLRAIPPGTLAAIAARALERPQGAEARRILEEVVTATDGHDRLIEPLSSRELLVLAEVEKGSTVAGIAAALYISPNTVKTHLRRLYRKLGVTTRSDAIRKAKSLGLGPQITR